MFKNDSTVEAYIEDMGEVEREVGLTGDGPREGVSVYSRHVGSQRIEKSYKYCRGGMIGEAQIEMRQKMDGQGGCKQLPRSKDIIISEAGKMSRCMAH